MTHLAAEARDRVAPRHEGTSAESHGLDGSPMPARYKTATKAARATLISTR